ncbi:MAG: TetR/AcrR family transcriptional regulator [Clostridia bacterium]|nr:TetR/AcrR family transcriptional regulator [Clostridia bacterium]
MDNKTKILECSLELFSLHGFNSIGIQDIVDKVGIKKPTLYHYYGSKEGLLQSLLSEHFKPFNNAVRQAADYHGDLPKTLNEVAFAFISFAKDNKNFYRMILSMSFDPPESITLKTVTPFLTEQFQLIEELFIKASNNHGNLKGRHMRYAVSFIGMLNTYISLLLNEHVSLTDDLVYNVVHQFMHGIFS